MAMQVAGTMTLGDLIAQVCACGARVEKATFRAWSDEFGEWYIPRYLVRGDRHVPLPTTDDMSYILDVDTVEFVCVRLGLEMDITRHGWSATTTLRPAEESLPIASRSD